MAETADVQSHFSPNKPLEPDILAELQSIMRLHDLSAEDLFFKWESYCIKLDVDTQSLSLQMIRNLKQSILDELERSQRQAHVKQDKRVGATPKQPAGGKGSNIFGMLDSLVPNTPGSTNGRIRGDTAGSGLKRKKLDVAHEPMSSPSGSMADQLKSMNGLG